MFVYGVVSHMFAGFGLGGLFTAGAAYTSK